jgi:hypothetical protein
MFMDSDVSGKCWLLASRALYRDSRLSVCVLIERETFQQKWQGCQCA